MEPIAGVEDERLKLALTRSAQGDSLAFAELVQEHQGMVFSIAYHFLRDRALAEDLAQEVFLELYQGLDRIQSRAPYVLVASGHGQPLHRPWPQEESPP